jgi:hypothetical protein
MLERVDAQVRIRHFCRNPHCRSKLAAPVDNKHHAFCTPGCHAVFYRSRCLVCEDPMRRKREEQRFKSGHNTCKKEYQRFPLVYDLLESILATTLAEIDSRHLETLDSSGSKVDPCAVLPRKMFWREKKGRGWYWEADLGEHRLFNRSGDLAARG